MTRDNNIKVGTVLHIVTTLLLAVLGYLWTVSQAELCEIKNRLRVVELNTIKLLTVTNTQSVKAFRLPALRPGESVEVTIVIVDDEAAFMSASPDKPQSRFEAWSDAWHRRISLRNPGPF